MLNNKIVKVLTSVMIALAMVVSMGQSQVNAAETLTTKLSRTRWIKNSSGTYVEKKAYALNTGNNHPAFQILSVSGNTTTGTNYYCLNATKGSTWLASNVGTAVTYDGSYDMVNDKSTISGLTTTYSNTVNKNYAQVMWILDHMYTPTGTSKTQVLANAGIVYGNTEGTYNGNDIYSYYYDETVNPTSVFSDEDSTLFEQLYGNTYGKGGYYYADTSGNLQTVVLSEEQVEVVQQAAIWHFTNYLADNNSEYNCYTAAGSTTPKAWLRYAQDPTASTINWKLLANDTTTSHSGTANTGAMLQEQASILYNYLVDGATKAASSGYTSTSVGTMNLAYTTSTKITESGNNYKIGPMKVTKTGNVTVSGYKVTTGTNTDITSRATLQNASGTTITSVPVNQEFYVVVPKTSVNGSVKVTVNGTTTGTEKKLWIKQTTSESNVEQPIVEIETKTTPLSKDLTATPDKPFDLALRKAITKVTNSSGTTKAILNENGLSATRAITADSSTIPETATYKHRKDPVVVEEGDIVTYTLSIYNEGEVDGYASVIVDQLPTGLASTLGSTVTSTKGTTYNVSYNSATNKITLTATGTAKNITAYGTTLDKDTINVTCKVTQKAATNGTTKKYLTNIAYINKAYDKDGNEQTRDRKNTESRPGTYPNNNASSLNSEDANSYKGNSSNPSVYNDTNNGTYYKGQEDDDDFEKVVVMPKEIDLALRKFITKISTDGNFSSTSTTTTYNRAPTVDTSKLKAGTADTATYKHSKKPISLDVGDYVLYTIRVYNEGDVAAYASQITDYLPANLDFVSDSSDTYISGINSKWTYNSTTRKVTTTSSAANATTLLGAFNASSDNGSGSALKYVDVQIICRVNLSTPANKKLTNIAEISQYKDKDGNVIPTDRDSTSNDLNYPSNPETYKDNEINKEYVPGQEDDDDFEKVVVKEYDKPTIHKGVKTVENQDSGYDKDEEHTWVIQSDIPGDIAKYKKYIITDDIDYRLNFSGVNKVVVKAGDTTLTAGTDYTITYTANTNGVANKTNSGTFKIVFIDTANGKTATTKFTNNKNKKVTVTFNTTFAKDSSGNLLAQLGTEVPNQAKLEYQNSAGEEGTPESETPEVHTGGVTLYKYYKNGNTKTALSGATFAIYKTEANARAGTNALQTATSDSNGIVKFIGLEYGEDAKDSESNKTSSGTYEYDSTKKSTKYWVKETKAPNGYTITNSNPIEVTISATSYETDATKITYQFENTPITGKYSVILVKEDENGEQLNEKATFEVNGQSKEVTGKLTIAKDVAINSSNVNTKDTYTIKETKAPDKYCEFGGTITVTAKKKLATDGKSYILDSISYDVKDENGNVINTEDAKIYVKDGNIYVEVKDYDKPEIHKGVKTVENQDSGYDIDEQHTWVIQSDIPGDIARYKKYVITDDIDYRLNFSGVENVVVKAGDTTLTAGTDYIITYTPDENGVKNKTKAGTLKIVFIDTANDKAATTKFTNNKNKKVTVTFKTTFAKDSSGNILAGLGVDVPNQAKLEYTNSANISGEDESEIPEVHTGGVTLFKYYNSGELQAPLEGAQFAIYKTEEDATAGTSALQTTTSDSNGIVKFIGLQYGEDAKDSESNKTSSGTYEYDSSKKTTKYWVKEIKAPDDYAITNGEPIEVEVNATSYIEERESIKYKIENKKQEFDIALRKYISKISSNGNFLDSENTITYNRVPRVDTSKLKTGEETTATYNHSKKPIEVNVGDYILYTIRVYNEGDLDGYASEITDYLPENLDFVADSTDEYVRGINSVWTYDATTRKVTTSTSDANKTLLKAYNKTTDKLSFADVQIICRVNSNTPANKKLTNIAEISEYKDKNGNEVEKDRDSESDNLNYPENHETYKDDEIEKEYVPGQEDDDDFEKVLVQPKEFDLALRKFIAKISSNGKFEDKTKTTTYNRVPNVDTSKLKSGTAKTATYNHSKKPIEVNVGDYILYTIRVYNEGDLDGYASEIIDYLPEYLDFVDSTDSYIKGINGNWTYDSKTRKVTTTKDAANAKTLLKAFNKAEDNGKGSGLSYVDVQIVCRVNEKAQAKKKLTNIAEISEYKDKDGKELEKDRDSEPENLNYPENPETYKDDEINKDYVPGQEDDDDFEKVVIKEKKKFDLALRKFITNISGKDVKTRIPQVSYKNGKITYTHPKDVVKVVVGDTVIYTLRVYNEGEINGYAEKVTDDIPDYLEYLPNNSTNKEYRWVMYDKDGKVTTNVKNAVKIVTDYTSKAHGETLMKQKGLKENPNLLKAFDPTKAISSSNPDYVDIKVAFKVKDPNSNKTVITNKAQISEDADEDGNPVDDIDSEPDKWNEGEDDQDYENVSVDYFDLSLLKYVTKAIVTVDGKTKVTKTGNNGSESDITPKVEINRRKINKTVVKFEYEIKITNEGNIAGYAKEITDYVPKGLKFYASDNKGWKDEGNNVISTTLLKNKLLKPGESATVKVVLRWINGSGNLSLKVNTAEISKDYNEKGVPDRDSTPDNKKPGEDDIDDAPVLLTISTGAEQVLKYVAGALVILVVIGGGTTLIKKYVAK